MGSRRWVLRLIVLMGVVVGCLGAPFAPAAAAPVSRPPLVGGIPNLPLKGDWDMGSGYTYSIDGSTGTATSTRNTCYVSGGLLYQNIAFVGMARYGGVWYFKYTADRWHYGSSTYPVAQCRGSATQLWYPVNIMLALDGRTLFDTYGNYTYATRINPGEKLGHYVAWQMLQNAGIPVTSSSGYVGPDRTNTTGTSLKDIRRNTIAGIIKFKLVSGQSFSVTGGTEDGHAVGTYSHGNGYKVDISTEPSSHIENSYGPVTTATEYGSSYPAYRRSTPSGEIFYDERGTGKPHWDVLYF